MHVVLKSSPSVRHHYRVELPNKRAVDFGVKGEASYMTHRDPYLVRAHLIEHGGVMSDEIREQSDPAELHRSLLWVENSLTEDWDDIYAREYWERWLLWSFPTLHQAKLFMTMRKGFLFMPNQEDMWYV